MAASPNEAPWKSSRLARRGQAGELVWPWRGQFAWPTLPGGVDRGQGWRGQGRQADRLGVPQLQLRRVERSERPIVFPAPGWFFTRRLLRSGKDRTGPSPQRPTTLLASRSWTNSRTRRALTLSSSASAISTTPGFRLCSRTPRRISAGASQHPIGARLRDRLWLRQGGIHRNVRRGCHRQGIRSGTGGACRLCVRLRRGGQPGSSSNPG